MKRKRKRKGNVGVDTMEGMACGERYNEFVALEMMVALEGENKEDESMNLEGENNEDESMDLEGENNENGTIDLEGEKKDERVEEMVYADRLGSSDSDGEKG